MLEKNKRFYDNVFTVIYCLIDLLIFRLVLLLLLVDLGLVKEMLLSAEIYRLLVYFKSDLQSFKHLGNQYIFVFMLFIFQVTDILHIFYNCASYFFLCSLCSVSCHCTVTLCPWTNNSTCFTYIMLCNSSTFVRPDDVFASINTKVLSTLLGISIAAPFRNP